MKKAFTLIELLVVVAIVGILASVTLISLNSGRERARDTKALTEMTQLMKLVQMCDANGGKIQSTGRDHSTGGGNICNLGSSYGTWPAPPEGGWVWGPIWTDGEDNVFNVNIQHQLKGRIYCGHYTGGGANPWLSRTDGLYRLAVGFSCSIYTDVGWE